MANTAFTVSRPAVRAQRAGGAPRVGRWALYAVLILIALAGLFPFAWMLMTSVKDLGDVIQMRFWPWPPFGHAAPQWGNYPQAISIIGTDDSTGLPLFVRQLLNTVFITAVIVLGVTLTSVAAAYAFAQLNFPAKGALFILVLSTLMIPDDLTLVPRAVMMFKNYLNWYNTYLARTVPFMASAFGIFLIRQFFMQVPRDLFDAARIDGAGHVRYMVQVMVPLSRPAILTVGLFNFIWAWNEFKWAQLVTSSSNMYMISVGLQDFLNGDGGSQMQLAMAVATMVVAPIVVLYFFTQQYFTEGITTTGLKG